VIPHKYMGPLPARFYPVAQLVDYTVHTWDIRQGRGVSHAMDGDAADLLVPFCFIVWQSTSDCSSVKPFTIGVRINGRNGGDTRVSVTPDGIALEPGEVADLPLVLEFDAATFVLTAMGRINGGTARGDADRGRGGHEADLDPPVARQGQLEEVGMLPEVAHELAVARVAEPGHAVPDVGEEALPGLLAVVADVDAGVDLRRDARRGGGLDRLGHLLGVDGVAPAAPAVQLGQGGRPREAAGMGGHDPRFAGQHGAESCRDRAGPGVAPRVGRAAIGTRLQS
jgi:hypothetical protein